ncbi:SdrD B-like domain-containing protein [Nonlabens tegetincola]|nr:SdrD B-like domain-containing protein [Nonlabens tegetincola]
MVLYFDDENGNGVQDAGELGIGGVTIDITNSDGTTQASYYES